MKGFPLLLTVAAFLVANSIAYGGDDSLKAGTQAGEFGAAPVATELKPNEIKIGNFTYSGILIQALKTDNLLQLVNPFAPAKYGSADDNTVFDPFTKKA